MNNINITLSYEELFLIEMALDEILWKMDSSSPTYNRFAAIDKLINSTRVKAETSDKPVEVNPIYDIVIEDLDFTIRTYNGLKRNKINTIGDLVKCTDKQILSINGMGKRCISEIDAKLAEYGLSRN